MSNQKILFNGFITDLKTACKKALIIEQISSSPVMCLPFLKETIKPYTMSIDQIKEILEPNMVLELDELPDPESYYFYSIASVFLEEFAEKYKNEKLYDTVIFFLGGNTEKAYSLLTGKPWTGPPLKGIHCFKPKPLNHILQNYG